MSGLWKALLLQSWVTQDRQLFLAVLSWLNPDPPQQGSQSESTSEALPAGRLTPLPSHPTPRSISTQCCPAPAPQCLSRSSLGH